MFTDEAERILSDKIDMLRSRQNQPYVYPAEQKRNVQLYTNPHWTDERFTKQDQVVFGTDEHSPGVKVEYADRLRMWDYEKSNAAYAAANASGKVTKSAQWYDVMLSTYYGKPMRLVGLAVGINRSDGYATQCFYFREVGE
jgi:hypothetical protein